MDLCECGTLASIDCFLSFDELNVESEDSFNENALHYLLRRGSLENVPALAEKILKKSKKLVNIGLIIG